VNIVRASISARRIQKVFHTRLRYRQVMREREAVAQIAAAYGRWRLRRGLAAAAAEARRARKRAPVEAAMQRRAEQQKETTQIVAISRIQSEWRARRIRRWCKTVDRAAQRLQRWCRGRWLAQKLLAEAFRLQARRLRQVTLPPPPPVLQVRSELAMGRMAPPSLPVAKTQQVDEHEETQLVRTPRQGASIACPPPQKKPCEPRDVSSGRSTESPRSLLIDEVAFRTGAGTPRRILDNTQRWTGTAASSHDDGTVMQICAEQNGRTTPRAGRRTVRLTPRSVLACAPKRQRSKSPERDSQSLLSYTVPQQRRPSFSLTRPAGNPQKVFHRPVVPPSKAAASSSEPGSASRFGLPRSHRSSLPYLRHQTPDNLPPLLGVKRPSQRRTIDGAL